MLDTTGWTPWQRFWHEPVRAERLALVRVAFAFFLLLDLLLQYWPHFEMFYGPEGVAPVGLHDEWLLSVWRWTILLFNTDHLPTVAVLFWLRVACTAALLVGFYTRLMNVLVWFLTYCFINRNPTLRNGADDVLMVGLFLLMLAPSGRAFSIDQWLRRRRLPPEQQSEAVYIPAWPVRLIQIQVCMIYLTTGLAKLIRVAWDGDGWFAGTWWEGSSLHYVLCDTTMSRWSFAQLPLPFWVTAGLTYAAVWWETLFPLFMFWRWSRILALWFGVLFHLGIFLTIEIGWFSFYTVSLYGVWVPGEFWDRLFRKVERGPTLAPTLVQERLDRVAAASR